MKSDSQRFIRAADDVASRVRKLLADIRPVIEQKHQLSGRSLDVAFTRGVAMVSAELAKVADLTSEGLTEGQRELVEVLTSHGGGEQ